MVYFVSENHNVAASDRESRVHKKLTLSKVPSSVDELKEILCDKLKIDQNFVIQYEDPDFDGSLCNLSDIEELPSEKVTLKIIWEMFKTASVDEPPRNERTGSETDFTLDTASTSSNLSSHLLPQSGKSVGHPIS